MAKKKKELKKIGGWLILVLVGFGLSILSFLFMIKTFLLTGNLQAWILTIVYCILAFLFVYSFILMVQKKKKSKKIAIFSLWTGFIAYIAMVIIDRWEILLSLRLNYIFIINIIFNGVVSLAITEYFLHSKRVKNTFVK